MPIDPVTAAGFAMAPLVPELLVTDIAASLHFWRDICGFGIVFERLYEGFAYLDLAGAQVMLEERGRNRNWISAPLEAPLGRGINFQIAISSIDQILASLAAADWPLFMPLKRSGTKPAILKRVCGNSWSTIRTATSSDFPKGWVTGQRRNRAIGRHPLAVTHRTGTARRPAHRRPGGSSSARHLRVGPGFHFRAFACQGRWLQRVELRPPAGAPPPVGPANVLHTSQCSPGPNSPARRPPPAT